SRTSTESTVTPAGVGVLRTIPIAVSASCFVLKTIIDVPCAESSRTVQNPFTNPCACFTRGTTCSFNAFRAPSNCSGAMLTFVTTAYITPPRLMVGGKYVPCHSLRPTIDCHAAGPQWLDHSSRAEPLLEWISLCWTVRGTSGRDVTCS